MKLCTLAAGVSAGALLLAATGAYAQEITGGVAGNVTENGKPAANARVTVTNTGTGVSVSTTTGPDGFYTVRNLPPGGPYKVTVVAADKTTETDQVDQVAIGAPYDLDIALGPQASEVTVTAAPVIHNASIATGPRETFSAKDIATLPSFARDLHDLVRLNPFVTIDEANSNALIIAGSNNHFNTIYVDGVRVSDDFGLNNNGYPTQRSPISLTVVGAVNLEIAPYDVQYGNFEGGILNIVTKSGSNTLHGSANYEWDSNAIAGKTVGSQNDGVLGTTPAATASPKFLDQDSSLTLGGPLWQDHVFFFVGYERYQSQGTSTFVPAGGAGTNVINQISLGEANEVAQIMSTAVGSATGTPVGGTGYGYNSLGFGGSAPVVNTDYFAKLDWYITDKQHLWFSYAQTDGNQYNTPDGSVTFDELNFASSDYVQAQNLFAYDLDLTSNWTSNFVTEAQVLYRHTRSPSKLLTGPFANFLVEDPVTGGEISLGPDISRQANDLGVQDYQVKLRGHYTVGDNVVTAGYEWEKLAEFDLFLQDATGAYTFDNACGPGKGLPNGQLINLADHVACALTYQNTASNISSAIAQTITDDTNTGYVEDEWHATPNLTLTAGVRAEFYSSPDKPLFDPRFMAQYGFSNSATINGENVVMPRAGFNWRPDPSLTVTGGVGLFSGGNPGVYTYNSFDTTGNIAGNVFYSCSVGLAPITMADLCGTPGVAGSASQTSAETKTGATIGTPALVGVTGSSIPIAVQTDNTTSANFGTGNANALDPRFKPPAIWKASISVVKLADFSQMSGRWGWLKGLGDGWRIHGDLILDRVQDQAVWADLFELANPETAALAASEGVASTNGKAPDGRPLFDPARYSQIVPLTQGKGCLVNTPIPCPAADVTGLVRSAGAFDIELTDNTQGEGMLWAIGLGKHFTDWLDVDYTFTSQHQTDATGATSSVARSNYIDTSYADPNHLPAAVSNYQILWEHRLTFDFEHNFFGDYRTAFRLFVYQRAGLPFSYDFCTTASGACTGNGVSKTSSAPVDGLFGQFQNTTLNQLLYVPKTSGGQVTANSDPLVIYPSSFDFTGFNTFLRQSGLIKYAGSIAPRNAFHSAAYGTGDIQFSQELPAWPPKGAKGEFYIDIINFPNLLNNKWGIDNQIPFPYAFGAVTAYNCQWSGVTFNNNNNAGANSLSPVTSNKITMPTCTDPVSGKPVKGNFYQYNFFRTPSTANATSQQLQAGANPPFQTWVVKMGVRFKF